MYLRICTLFIILIVKPFKFEYMNTYKVTWLTMEGEDKVSIKIANSSNEAERKVCDEELNVFIVTNIEEIAE